MTIATNLAIWWADLPLKIWASCACRPWTNLAEIWPNCRQMGHLQNGVCELKFFFSFQRLCSLFFTGGGNNFSYYMASSASGQDDPNCAIWLATRAGKMEPSCPLGTTRCIPQEKFPWKPYNKSFIDQVCSVKMAGYWPCSFFVSLWTLTTSRSITTQKKRTWPISSHLNLTLGQ